jgi:hypothetical protein
MRGRVQIAAQADQKLEIRKHRHRHHTICGGTPSAPACHEA